jgi:hypothetical protein
MHPSLVKLEARARFGSLRFHSPGPTRRAECACTKTTRRAGSTQSVIRPKIRRGVANALRRRSRPGAP